MGIWIVLRDKETNRISKKVDLKDIIYNRDEVEFEFDGTTYPQTKKLNTNDNDEENIVETLPYNDFLFYKDDYTVFVDYRAPYGDFDAFTDLDVLSGGI